MKRKKVSDYQSASDICALLLKAVRNSATQARQIAPYFNTGDPVSTCEKLYTWTRQNLVYDQEPNTDQTAKTLGRFLADGYGDCKHYSVFNASILKALGYPVYFRVIDQIGRWNHIYTVVKLPRQTIICDSVYPYFNQEANYLKKQDIKI